MLPSYQFKVADIYNIPIGNVKKGVSNFLKIEKYVLHYEISLFLLISFEVSYRIKLTYDLQKLSEYVKSYWALVLKLY